MSFWIMAIIGALTANIWPWIGMGYNPGFLTTWLVLNPFCILTILYAWKFNILTSMEWILAFIVGGAYILVLMLNTRLRREQGSS
jgi:hypothetical protein